MPSVRNVTLFPRALSLLSQDFFQVHHDPGLLKQALGHEVQAPILGLILGELIPALDSPVTIFVFQSTMKFLNVLMGFMMYH